MPSFMYSIPSLPLFLMLFFVAGIISAISFLLVSYYLPLTQRKPENVASGYIAATIGVMYAVLAGFVILYAMNNYDKAGDITMHEATTITKIFRDASRLPEPLRTEVQRSMQNYANTIIQVEFPALAKDKFIRAGLPILEALDHKINAYQPPNMMIFFRLHGIHTAINELYTTYDQRMDINNSALTPDLWALFITSSILTLVINCILGISMRLHIVLQSILTLMVSAILYLIIAMDHPFSGSFSISSNALQTSVNEMNIYEKNRGRE